MKQDWLWGNNCWNWIMSMWDLLCYHKHLRSRTIWCWWSIDVESTSHTRTAVPNVRCFLILNNCVWGPDKENAGMFGETIEPQKELEDTTWCLQGRGTATRRRKRPRPDSADERSGVAGNWTSVETSGIIQNGLRQNSVINNPSPWPRRLQLNNFCIFKTQSTEHVLPYNFKRE